MPNQRNQVDKKTTLLILMFGVLLPGRLLQAQDLNYAKKHVIQSKFLHEERTFWVNLPAAYNDPNFGQEKYPVIYVLDGKSSFFPIAGLVEFMSGRESVNFQIPEVIVVGIDTSDRLRVLTPTAVESSPDGQRPGNPLQGTSGEGGLFFDFLTQELIPVIEAEYRTLPFRVYIGHSLGGLTCTHTLLHHPGVFNGYLAIDPSLWWNRGKMVNESPQQLKDFHTEKIQRYYLSHVDSEEQSPMGNSIHQFGFSLAAHAPGNLKWKLHPIPHTDHSSIPLLSWYHGLLFVFQGYDMSHYAMMQDPDSIEPHFERLAKTTGLSMDPPQTIFWILAHYLTSPDRYPDPEKALKVIHMGLKYHPESAYLYEKLGAAYELKNEIQKALKSYLEALRLNPGNNVVEEKIQRLRMRMDTRTRESESY